MKHRESIFRVKGRRVGLAFVCERGLDIEIWDGSPHPCWSVGVVGDETSRPPSPETVDVSKVPYWLLVLPTYSCTTRYVWLPANLPSEIASMLEFELPGIVPCSTQSWAWDYSVVGEREDGASEVLVFLSPLTVVESGMEQARALGIEPRLVTVSAALRAAKLACAKGAEGLGTCGYVWWDHESVDFLVMDGRKLAFLRGVRTLGPDADRMGFVEAEIGRSLSMLRKRGISPDGLPLHFGGTNPEVPQLAEKLGRSAGVLADPDSDRMTYDRVCMRKAAMGLVHSASRPNGHAQTACVNLLPKHLKEKSRRVRRQHQAFIHGLRIILVGLLILLGLRLSVWRTTRLLQKYGQRLTQIAPSAQKLQFLQGQLSMIQTQVQGSVSMLDLIGQLYEILPRDVTIHYLNIDQNRQMVVRAQAKRLSQAFDCIDPLERSAYFVNVRQSYAYLREIEGQVLIDFELRADLEKPRTKEASQ